MTDQSPSTMQDVRNQRIGAATRTLGLIAMLHDDPGHERLARAYHLRENLTDEERAALLEALVMTFPADQAERLVVQTFGEAGVPTGALSGRVIDEARFWARDASPAEHRGYAQACLEAMSEAGQKTVFAWLKRKLGA